MCVCVCVCVCALAGWSGGEAAGQGVDKGKRWRGASVGSVQSFQAWARGLSRRLRKETPVGLAGRPRSLPQHDRQPCLTSLTCLPACPPWPPLQRLPCGGLRRSLGVWRDSSLSPASHRCGGHHTRAAHRLAPQGRHAQRQRQQQRQRRRLAARRQPGAAARAPQRRGGGLQEPGGAAVGHGQAARHPVASCVRLCLAGGWWWCVFGGAFGCCACGEAVPSWRVSTTAPCLLASRPRRPPTPQCCSSRPTSWVSRLRYWGASGGWVEGVARDGACVRRARMCSEAAHPLLLPPTLTATHPSASAAGSWVHWRPWPGWASTTSN